MSGLFAVDLFSYGKFFLTVVPLITLLVISSVALGIGFVANHYKSQYAILKSGIVGSNWRSIKETNSIPVFSSSVKLNQFILETTPKREIAEKELEQAKIKLLSSLEPHEQAG